MVQPREALKSINSDIAKFPEDPRTPWIAFRGYLPTAGLLDFSTAWLRAFAEPWCAEEPDASHPKAWIDPERGVRGSASLGVSGICWVKRAVL